MNAIFEHPVKRLTHVTAALAMVIIPFISVPATANTAVHYAFQGKKWTAKERDSFYSQDQGSQMIPLAWIQALKQPNGSPFLADSLSRYGYLPNPASPTAGLPVGFTTNQQHLGMTCAACHVREIEVSGIPYRIDGGPSISDFQSFAADLDTAVANVLNNPQAFDNFAHSVLGKTASAEKQAQLRKEVEAWHLPYHTIMDRALPKDAPWGPARLDAVGMIFNRLTGLDIGTTPDHIIADNIHLADAPVRFPFLWNASIQDKTQWPGFSDNGNSLLALARNFGEVVGVFNHFYPQKDDWRILGVDYLHTNSANFSGLKKLEDSIKKISPPQWPWKEGIWKVDSALAEQGKAIYESKTKTEDGGCITCHGISKGSPRSFTHETWATPLCNVGTDTREYSIVGWTVNSGVLAGAQIPFLDKPLQAENEAAFNVLTTAVLGSLLQHEFKLTMALESFAKKEAGHLLGEKGADKLKASADKIKELQAKLINADNIDLKGAFHSLNPAWKSNNVGDSNCKTDFTAKTPAIAYESRVLQGIWATAPYLHNGSVPSLSALLTPVAQRPTSFKIGPNYDPATIGLATEQTKFDYVLKTTDCSDLGSGNSRCGHEYGTQLSAEEKKALLEYLKTL